MPERTDDPGWSTALRTAPLFLVPVLGPMRSRSAMARDGLVALRTMFCAFAGAIVAIGVVVVVLDRGGVRDEPVDTTLPALAVLVAGATSLPVGHLLRRRTLACEHAEQLAQSYRNRFVVGLALAESAALIGFVMFLLTNAAWLFAVGAAFTVIGFVQIAPTVRRLADEQHHLRSEGCRHSLVAALRG